MNKLNNKPIIVAAIYVIAFLALFCRGDDSNTPIIAEQISTTTGAEIDDLSNAEQTPSTTNALRRLRIKQNTIRMYRRIMKYSIIRTSLTKK